MTATTSTPIDPSVIKFAVALTIAAAVVGLVGKVSKTAQVILILLVVTLLLIDNPVLIGFINLGSQSLNSTLK